MTHFISDGATGTMLRCLDPNIDLTVYDRHRLYLLGKILQFLYNFGLKSHKSLKQCICNTVNRVFYRWSGLLQSLKQDL